MKKKDFLRLLGQIGTEHPELQRETQLLVGILWRLQREDLDLEQFLNGWRGHEDLKNAIQERLAILDNAAFQETQKKPTGRVFRVHSPFSKSITQRISASESNEGLHTWANSIKSIPEYTLPLPEVDRDFILNARKIWAENICGNENVLNAVLRHSVEYSQTGHTMPILLVGEPGVGKSLVARNYGHILNLPSCHLSGPSAVAGRGLSGAPSIFVGAGAGVIAQAMIDFKAGNPVICMDELDKTCGGGYYGTPDIQNELLSLLDESGAEWMDNFLEIRIDASHIPFVFTANDKDLIPTPLLDRMEVIQMDQPELDIVHRIMHDFTLPRVMETYKNERIDFADRELNLLVDQLWADGHRSLRTYQKAINILVSDAFLQSIEQEQTVKIQETDIRKVVAASLENQRTKSIGFHE